MRPNPLARPPVDAGLERLFTFDPEEQHRQSIAEIVRAVEVGKIAADFLERCLTRIGDNTHNADLQKIAYWLDQIGTYYRRESE
jgi:hypothetical protein